MLISRINYNELSKEQIQKILFPGNPNNEEIYGDCIMVFGGPHAFNIERANKAVELYRENRSPKILFSGGDKWGQRKEVEAVTLKRMALEEGVPEKDIMIETLSNNTKENVISSLLVLDREIGLHNIKRIIAISHPGHLRRCLLTLKMYMPRSIQFIMVPSNTDIPEDWWEKPTYREMALKEVRGLIWYAKNGHILDEEIDF